MGSVAHGLTRGGTMQRIANIPLSIWAGMHQVDEHAEILRNKRKFYAWLNRHPEYRTGRTVIKDRV